MILNYLERHQSLYNLCVWLGADHLAESCLAAAGELGFKVEPAHAVGDLSAAIAQFAGTKLVVLDNADAVQWDDVAPLVRHGHVVLTTRNRDLLDRATEGGVIEVLTFTEPQALQLLGCDESAADAVELVRELGCLPLAVEHARSAMVRRGATAGELLSSLRKAAAGNVAESDLKRAYSDRVLAVFDLSLDSVSAAVAASGLGIDKSVTRRLAVACGYLHAERIPRSLLAAWLVRQFELKEPQVAVVLEQLVQFSIVTVRDGGASFDMHRILQAALRAKDSAARDELACLVETLGEEFGFDYNATDHTRTERLAAHAESCALQGRAAAERLAPATQLRLADVLMHLGRWFKFRALYKKVSESFRARVWRRWRRRRRRSPPASARSVSPWRAQALDALTSCLTLRRAHLPADDARMAVTNVDLGQLHNAMGHYGKALEAFEEGVRAYRKHFPASPALATALSSLGITCGMLGRLDDAIAHQREAQTIRCKSLGESHEDVAHSLVCVGEVLLRQGKYTEALQNFEQALPIRRKALGDDHPAVAATLSNIGNAQSPLGNFAKALEYHEDALRIRRRVLATDHPDIATSLSCMGDANSALGNYAKALELLEEALRIRRAAMGPDHPVVAATLADIGATHASLGNYTKALELHEEALCVWRQALGPDHADVAFCLSNIGSCYGSLGNCSKALDTHTEALRIRRAALGPEHPDVATSLACIGNAHVSLGQHAKALESYEEDYRISLKALGPDHPDVAASLCNLGDTRRELGDHAGALRDLEEALRIRRASLGSQHDDVALTLRFLGRVHADMGRYEQALECQREDLRISRAALGPEHATVGTSLRNLGSTLTLKQDYTQAADTLREALCLHERALGAEHPNSVRTRAWLLRAEGCALREAGQSEEAAARLEDSKRLFDSDPQYGPAHKHSKGVAEELARCRS